MKELQIPEGEVKELQKQVSSLEQKAQSVSVESNEEYEQAVAFVSELKETGSEIKKKKESITKPLNDALRNARNLFKPIEDQFSSAEKIVKQKMLDFRRKQEEEARKKEEQIAKRVNKGTMKYETAEKKVDELESSKVSNTVSSGRAKAQVKKIPKVRIKNEADIPREYLVPDMVRIRRDALSGKEIAGVEVYYEETIAAS